MNINESIASTIGAVNAFQSQALDKRKPLRNRDLMLEATSSAVDSVQSFLSATGKERSISGIRKKMKHTLNVLTSIQDGVQERTLNYQGMKTLASDQLGEFLDDLEVLYSEYQSKSALASESAGSTLELSEIQQKEREAKDADTAKNAKDLFKQYRAKHLNKIPSRLRNPGGIQVVEMPLMAQFEQAAFMRSTTLQKLGVPFTRVGSGQDYAGATAMVIFEKQNLLMFSKSAAIELAQEEFEEHKQGSDSAKNSTMRRNLNRQIKQKQAEIAQLFGKKTKDQQAKFIERMDSEQGVNFDTLAKNLYRDPELYKEVMNSLKAMQGQLTNLRNKHADLEAKKKDAARDLKNREKRMLDVESILFKTASHTVDELSERSANEYTLITGTPLTNPKNSDLVMFWFIPRSLYKRMTSLTGGNMKIARWGLPWQQKRQLSS